MIIKRLTFLIYLIFMLMPAIILAEGNIKAGKAKSINCASCHGDNGNSLIPTFPKLAGQHSGYLANQLKAFKENFRNSSIMANLVTTLNDNSIDDIVAYYASQKITTNPLPVIELDDDTQTLSDLLALGRALYQNGNPKTKVASCSGCHGPTAEGNKQASFPALRSQHADYLIQSLSDFKKNIRNTKKDNIMHLIAKKMTDQEIRAVSYHISIIK